MPGKRRSTWYDERLGRRMRHQRGFPPLSFSLLILSASCFSAPGSRNAPVDAPGSSLVAPRNGEGNPSASAEDEWVIDNITSIHGLRPTVLGAPVTTATDQGQALCFDGDDGILLAKNPLEGLAEFTLQILFRCDPLTSAQAALAEPRFLHIETEAASRATVEARVTETSFALDTFLRSGSQSRTLLDAAKRHPVAVWHWAALTYGDGQMRHYVDGVEDAAGPLSLMPFGPGKTSIGVRQNFVHWFKGCVRKLRISPRALPPERLEKL